MASKKESKKEKQERMDIVLERLGKLYPEPKTELNYNTSWQLLVATILSAQCTDARVNIVTDGLFKKYKTPEDFLNLPVEELEKEIYSTGFYRAKAKNIKGAAKKVLEEHNGEVPGSMEELVKLPGVGRKTANVILGHIFNKPGVVVDTHVKRITNLLGFTQSKDPDKIEIEVEKYIPKEERLKFSHWMIYLGRNTCIARRPKCHECILSDICPSSKA